MSRFAPSGWWDVAVFFLDLLVFTFVVVWLVGGRPNV